MARGAVAEGIFAALQTLPLAPLLGDMTDTNLRLYSGWPQESPETTPLDPPSEGGWLVFDTTQTDSEYGMIYEDYETTIFVLHPRYSACDTVIDLLDTVWHWRIPQQHDVLYGDHYLIMSRRTMTKQQFNQTYKLYEKAATYRMRFVKSPAEV